mgnify:CR=1 FL=1
MENHFFRLRRAKMKGINLKLYQNQPNLAKIAPEGREKFSGRKYFSFLKTKKKTAGTRGRNKVCAAPAFAFVLFVFIFASSVSLFFLIFLFCFLIFLLFFWFFWFFSDFFWFLSVFSDFSAEGWIFVRKSLSVGWCSAARLVRRANWAAERQPALIILRRSRYKQPPTIRQFSC